MDAKTIGKYFLSKNIELTDIQIQKLTYYAYVWYMVKNECKLFEEMPEAWVHGPVFRTLYASMKDKKFYVEKLNDNEIQSEIFDFLDTIYTIYGKYSGNELENMTHCESPWKNARLRAGVQPKERCMEKITDEDIIGCYAN